MMTQVELKEEEEKEEGTFVESLDFKFATSLAESKERP
jgi:hypothetical protein